MDTVKPGVVGRASIAPMWTVGGLLSRTGLLLRVGLYLNKTVLAIKGTDTIPGIVIFSVYHGIFLVLLTFVGLFWCQHHH